MRLVAYERRILDPNLTAFNYPMPKNGLVSAILPVT
jgi:hypothetical protein